MGITAFSIATLCSIFVELYLLSAFIFDKPYQYLAYGYYICIPLDGIFLIIHILPQSIYRSLLREYDEQRIAEEEAYQESVQILWSILVKIVPMIQHRPKLLRSERMEAELGHARYIIWTHYPRTKPITPEQEVLLILELTRSNTIITGAGPATPMKTLLKPQQHYIAVAQGLKAQLSDIQPQDVVEEINI
jgi:hypothetical protein